MLDGDESLERHGSSAGRAAQVLDFHRSGKMRVLAVTSPKRLTGAPEIPTAAEAGLPGLVVTASLGLLAPAGTPIAIITCLIDGEAVVCGARTRGNLESRLNAAPCALTAHLPALNGRPASPID